MSLEKGYEINESSDFLAKCLDILGKEGFKNTIIMVNNYLQENALNKSTSFTLPLRAIWDKQGGEIKMDLSGIMDSDISILDSFETFKNILRELVSKIHTKDGRDPSINFIEREVEKLIHSLLASAYGRMSPPKNIMTQLCEENKKEINELMSLHVKNYIVPAILNLYTDEEIKDAQEHFGKENYHHLYAIINSAKKNDINLKSLCKQKLEYTLIFIENIGSELFIEFFNKSSRNIVSSFELIYDSWKSEQQFIDPPTLTQYLVDKGLLSEK